jgi:hypothetical protein
MQRSIQIAPILAMMTLEACFQPSLRDPTRDPGLNPPAASLDQTSRYVAECRRDATTQLKNSTPPGELKTSPVVGLWATTQNGPAEYELVDNCMLAKGFFLNNARANGLRQNAIQGVTDPRNWGSRAP